MKLTKSDKKYWLIHGDQILKLKPSELATAYRLIRDGIVMENSKHD